MSEQVKQLVEKLQAEWLAFKSDNDRRLKEVERTGRADPLTEEKVNKHAVALGELQAQLDELNNKTQRRPVASDDPAAEAKAEHRKAFNAFLRKGDDRDLARLQAKISVGSDTEGGYLVPDTLDSEIEKYERDNTPMRSACRVIQVSNENYEKLVKQGEAASGWVGETEARPETGTPTWASLSPYFGELYAKPKLTQKALDDAAINLEAELGEDIGIEFAEQENDAFTRGTGVKKPKGILGYTLAATADGSRALGQVEKLHTGSSGNFVADKMIDLIHKLKRGYRANAAWMMTSLSLAAVRKLKDETSGMYLFQPSFLAGAPATLLGYPVIENDDMSDPAADANAAMFGDFRRAYTILDVRGTRVLRDPYTDKPFVVFYATKRVGGFLVNDRAVKVLTLSA